MLQNFKCFSKIFYGNGNSKALRSFTKVFFVALVCMLMLGITMPIGAMHIGNDGSAYYTANIMGGDVFSQAFSDNFSMVGVLGQDFGAHNTGNPLEVVLWNGMTIVAHREIIFTVTIDNLPLSPQRVRNAIAVEDVMEHLGRAKNVDLVYAGDARRYLIDGETLALQTTFTRLETTQLTLPYETHENRTNQVWAGDVRTRYSGIPGIAEETARIIYVGGVEVSREIVEEHIITPPRDAIFDVGTGQLGAIADVESPYFHYARRVRMEATAYTAGFCCTGKHPGDRWYRITASGREVEHGIVAVDRRIIPLGTRLYVEGYGFALAADVGGAIRGYKIDLFMEELHDALQFGRRHLYVWILDEI